MRRNGTAGAWPAVLAVLALLIQGLVPASAVAQDARSVNGELTVVLCTANGLASVTLPGAPPSHDGSGCIKCHDCVMAAMVVFTPPTPQLAPVRYSQIIEAERVRPDDQPPVSRPPPRPPSQGPPTAFDL